MEKLHFANNDKVEIDFRNSDTITKYPRITIDSENAEGWFEITTRKDLKNFINSLKAFEHLLNEG